MPVAAPEALSSGAVSAGLVHLLRLGRVGLDDLVDLRIAIERAAVSAAAGRRGSSLAIAGRAVDAMRAAGADPAAFDEADVRFHLALAVASGNEAFVLVMRVVRDSMAYHLADLLHATSGGVSLMRRLADEHEAILTAIESGDADEAGGLMQRHLQRAYGRSTR